MMMAAERVRVRREIRKQEADSEADYTVRGRMDQSRSARKKKTSLTPEAVSTSCEDCRYATRALGTRGTGQETRTELHSQLECAEYAAEIPRRSKNTNFKNLPPSQSNAAFETLCSDCYARQSASIRIGKLQVARSSRA